jgi:hypothetical protein
MQTRPDGRWGIGDNVIGQPRPPSPNWPISKECTDTHLPQPSPPPNPKLRGGRLQHLRQPAHNRAHLIHYSGGAGDMLSGVLGRHQPAMSSSSIALTLMSTFFKRAASALRFYCALLLTASPCSRHRRLLIHDRRGCPG